jgi:hypothetical protein
MELLNVIFSQGFWVSDSRFCLVFYPRFPVLQNAIHEEAQVFLFREFFAWILKPEMEFFNGIFS